MDYRFEDALTGSIIEFDYATQDIALERSSGPSKKTKSIFFPGCSLLNYAMPLVAAVQDTLEQQGQVDGISILCCGKILSYEENGAAVRREYEEELKEHILDSGIERIICACPNCVKALREAFEEDVRMTGVELVVLPQLLADIGYRIDPEITAELLKGDKSAQVLLGTHDSCPDREYGEFASGLRAILPEGLWADPPHSWKKSVCCGSLPRAAGKMEQADKCAALNGEEAQEIGADAIVTACMSCAFQLNMAQNMVPAIHFLELLYNWRIDWAHVGYWMKFRFLFNEALGATEKQSGRNFIGVEATPADEIAANDVAISRSDVTDVGE